MYQRLDQRGQRIAELSAEAGRAHDRIKKLEAELAAARQEADVAKASNAHNMAMIAALRGELADTRAELSRLKAGPFRRLLAYLRGL